MKQIQKAIKDLLIEDTGIHMLDSGMDDNRSWQRNRKIKDFNKIPIFTFDDSSVYRNIYPYLVDNLSITSKSKDLQKNYESLFKDSKDYDLNDMMTFIDKLRSKDLIRSDNYIITDKPTTTNTYNYGNCLSQVLQYVIFYDGIDHFILLQIHGGCDVRGGYTSPKIFQLTDAEQFMMQQHDYNITTKKGSYFTDDGYNFYDDEDANKTKSYKDLIKEKILSVC